MKQKFLYKRYVKGTPYKAEVVNKKAQVCCLTRAVLQGLDIGTEWVHINTRVIKHLYDAKPAEEFFCVLENLQTIVKYPEEIYENKEGKRGQFILVKKIGADKYICSIEILEKDNEIAIVTAFRIRKNSYLDSYKLLWSWEDDTPPS